MRPLSAFKWLGVGLRCFYEGPHFPMRPFHLPAFCCEATVQTMSLSLLCPPFIFHMLWLRVLILQSNPTKGKRDNIAFLSKPPNETTKMRSFNANLQRPISASPCNFQHIESLILISNWRKTRRRSAAERAFELFCKTFFFSDIFIVYCFAQMLSIQLAEIGEDLVLHFYSHILHFALSLFSSSQQSR